MNNRSRSKAAEWTAKNSEGFVSPVGITVDTVVFTVRDERLQVLLVERDEHGVKAIPGGFVSRTEDVTDTASRKLMEKTGLAEAYLEQLAAFTAPYRDPRGWIPSIAFVALVPPRTEPSVSSACWVDARLTHRLAFDHEQILNLAVSRIAGKLWWSNIAVGILAEPFTLAEARGVYQAISQKQYDPSTFARDLKATGLVVPTGDMRSTSPGRPATLFRFSATQPVWGEGNRKRLASPDG
ncbi:MAG: NUDIX hydrolase [Solirubrobacterales bacterium]